MVAKRALLILNDKKPTRALWHWNPIGLGYAFGKGKRTRFTPQPTYSNILSLLQASNKMNEELYV